MTSIPTYGFSGDSVTLLGMLGIASTLVVIVIAYRRYWNSPFRR